MHEYHLTGRTETDKCLSLANKAHNLFFDDPLKNKVEFCKVSQDFLFAVEHKFLLKTGKPNLTEALEFFFTKKPEQTLFFTAEFKYIRRRLKIIIENPDLLTKDRIFLLEHTARFMEIVLPFACSVEEEVEHNHKFGFQDIIDKEFTFFTIEQAANETNKYKRSFYDSAFRTQRALNGLYYIKDKLNLNDPEVKRMYDTHGMFDTFSSLIFSRMAFEQFLKYMTTKVPHYFKKMVGYLNLAPSEKEKFLKSKDYEYKKINNPSRIEVLLKDKLIDKLIANELNYANQKGNNNVHSGLSASYSACYTNLLLLSYLEKAYK